jgi:DNA-binding NtrC family response regulator
MSTQARTVIVATADAALRHRLSTSLTELRWRVFEANGGAEAMARLEDTAAEAMLVDSWLPDLEVGEFSSYLRRLYPELDLLRVDGVVSGTPSQVRSPRRHELLHALREAQEEGFGESMPQSVEGERSGAARLVAEVSSEHIPDANAASFIDEMQPDAPPVALLPDMIGAGTRMRQLSKVIRLVAARHTTVLIEGETGTGKELVARAVHKLSLRASKSFTVLNCAAIPEALLEAELFGHTRGAFTGAVTSRTGRIEAAHGGTLFLDEIGEMPLALQAKMLRFLENGELQKVGDNETIRVDVRVVAATHQPLEQHSKEGRFRLDLYHRLAVFPVEVPALRDRQEDISAIATALLSRMAEDAPAKRLTQAARAKLEEFDWPGNVRQLMHVLERGVILSENRHEIEASEIVFGRVTL